MKPPETITLIDLEGKPIYELTTPKSCFYTPVEELIATSMYNNVGYRESNPAKLINFLNDQLTFIRNGMWETLAIYQATLGRYTEVPWYENNTKLWTEWNLQIKQRQHPTSMHFLSAEKDGEVFSFRFDGFCFDSLGKQRYLLFITDKHFKHEEKSPSPCPSLCYPRFVKYFPKIKPSNELFIKHYPDVFSKIEPLEGE